MSKHTKTKTRGRLPSKKRSALIASGGILAGIAAAGTLLSPLANATDSAPLPPDTDPTSVDVTATDGTTVRVVNGTLSLVTTVDKSVVTPGSKINYTYKATATGASFGSIRVVDDKCEGITGPSGDVNANALLDPGEAWLFGCSTTVLKDVTNAARLTGRVVLPGATNPTPTPTPTPTSTGGGLKDGTYLGPVTAISIPGENSNYSIQVQAVVSGGRITDVTVPLLNPTNATSRFLAADAKPTLISEALAAQSASVASVSGATYTSTGFKTSLSAALAQAAA